MVVDPDLDIIIKEKYPVEDLLESFKWVGKSPFELKIDEKYLDDIDFDIKGKIFDAKADGKITFDLKDVSNKIIHDVTIYVDEEDLPFLRCLEKLNERYSKPVSSGEEPYAEANGGTVIWYSFYTGKGIVHISMGENNTFYTIRYRKTPKPE
ncbi:MAG: hypothetical protein IKD94_03390 [Erysipelotrichaceae bacterium]|nr:hypothetical protein [Erysipelotrichaceae bacterium]